MANTTNHENKNETPLATSESTDLHRATSLRQYHGAPSGTHPALLLSTQHHPGTSQRGWGRAGGGVTSHFAAGR